MTEHEKILDKLAKIKAHADSAAQIGSEQEAQAFAEMLQRLLMKHKLEMTDIEFAKMEKDEPVETHDIDFAKHSDGKAYDVEDLGRRVDYMEKIAAIVARAHFCRILVHPHSSRITLVGRKTDCEVAEYMIVTLQRAVRRIAIKEEARYRRENGQARGFKSAFRMSFVTRLSERYEAERRSQEGASELALVRVNKSEAAVNEYMKQFSNAKAIRRSTIRNMDGWLRGKDAADKVNLRSNAVKQGATRGELN